MTLQKSLLFLALAVVASLLWASPILAASPPASSSIIKTQSFTLGPLHVDKIYPAMTGPVLQETVHLGDASAEGNIWITSYRVDVLDDKGDDASARYLCHASASLGMNGGADMQQYILTVSQGMAEMNMPPGYAIKTPNVTQNAFLMAQALNDDAKTDLTLRYKMTFRYAGDAEAKRLMLKPLRQVMIFVSAADVKSQTPAGAHGDDTFCAHGPGMRSLMGAGPTLFYVPPGRHEYHSSISLGGQTIHFIKLHLHAYGESLALIDKTANRVLWKGWGETDIAQGALTKTDFYSSAEGLKIEASHQYELVTVYNNTTGQPVDAMALLRLYVSDN
jgi:hypothetical protein